MSCQKNIVQKIRDNEADYVIGLKGNQPALLEDVSLYFQDFIKGLPSLATRDKDHGRIEKREYRLLTDLSWLPERSDWAGLKAVGSVCLTVTRNGTTSIDTRFFITSLTDINRFSYAARKHWAIENQLHWSLDVIFDEDSSRARKDFSPLNLNVLRKTALALCKHADFGPRVSMKKNALLPLLIQVISSNSFLINFKCGFPEISHDSVDKRRLIRYNSPRVPKTAGGVCPVSPAEDCRSLRLARSLRQKRRDRFPFLNAPISLSKI